jgi:hypothetical protein
LTADGYASIGLFYNEMADRKDNTRPGLDLPARPLDRAAAADLADDEVAQDAPAGLGLSVPLHTRISAHADYMLRAEAARLHRTHAAMARDLIYQGLGLIKAADAKPPKRRK